MSKSSELRVHGFRHSDFVIPSDFVIRHSGLRITVSGDDPKRRRRCALPAQSKSASRPGGGDVATEPKANAPASWSAAGSEAPRRLGFCIRGAPEGGLSPTVRRESQAPSPLPPAAAVQKPPP